MNEPLLAALAGATLAVIALLVAEKKKRGAWLAKPLASLGFIAVAWTAGALDSSYGQTVLLGLVLCALGDVLLIAQGAGGLFLGGMASFALGHAAYAGAFWQLGVDRSAALVALAAMIGVVLATLRWLGPHLPADMRVPIRGYMAIISAMVALAVGASVATGNPWLALGALSFAISDLSVARERFVHSAYANLVWGLPLYYAAQLVLACTVSPR